MRQKHCVFSTYALRVAGLPLCLVLLALLPTRCQTVEIRGTITDAFDKSPVNGADVVVRSASGATIAHVISGADGHYSAMGSGLNSGDHVNAYYSRGGFVPHPAGPVDILISSAGNTKDIELIHDVSDQAYWAEWANAVKAKVDVAKIDSSKRANFYDKAWSTLEGFGLSPLALAQAARQLAAISPNVPFSVRFESFASVDMDKLQLAETDIRTSIDSQTELSNKYGIPSDVAGSIVASEVKNQAAPLALQQRYTSEFGNIWGSEAKEKLSDQLTTHPMANLPPSDRTMVQPQ